MIGIKSREGISEEIKESYLKLLDSERKYKFLDFLIFYTPNIMFKFFYFLFRVVKYGKIGYR